MCLESCAWRDLPRDMCLERSAWRAVPGELCLESCVWRALPGEICAWRDLPRELFLERSAQRSVPGELCHRAAQRRVEERRGPTGPCLHSVIQFTGSAVHCHCTSSTYSTSQADCRGRRAVPRVHWRQQGQWRLVEGPVEWGQYSVEWGLYCSGASTVLGGLRN